MNKEYTFEELYKHKVIKDICKAIAIQRFDEILLKCKGGYIGEYEYFIKSLGEAKRADYTESINNFFNDCKKYLNLNKKEVLRLI